MRARGYCTYLCVMFMCAHSNVRTLPVQELNTLGRNETKWYGAGSIRAAWFIRSGLYLDVQSSGMIIDVKYSPHLLNEANERL